MAASHSHGAGTLKSTAINGVKLYSLTGSRYVAPWVVAKKKRALRKDKGTYLRNPPAGVHLFLCVENGDVRGSNEGKLRCFLAVEYQRRLDLIHDLRFETATTKIKLTPDDQYVIASGVLTIKLDMPMFSLIYVLLSGSAACLYICLMC